LKELLMMGIVRPETCWAASILLSNEFYDWLLHLVGCFYLKIHIARSRASCLDCWCKVNVFTVCRTYSI
jgi:hypothetical protein